jgi:hypothetical protein
MKKLIIGIGSLLITAFVVVLFVNANNSAKNTGKAETEAEISPCPASCSTSAASATAECDPEKCKELKCDPATCSVHKVSEQPKVPVCGTSAACPGTCHTATKGE